MENEEQKEVKNHQSYSPMHPKKVSSPLVVSVRGSKYLEQRRKRYDKTDSTSEYASAVVG